MKSPLSYQISEYDCGPTSLINGLNFLFERKEIDPKIIKGIYEFCLDRKSKKNEEGKGGTSDEALELVGKYLENNIKNISTQIKKQDEVFFEKDKYLYRWIKDGGVIILKCMIGLAHYILVTGIDDKYIYAFDPYFRKNKFGREGVYIINEPLKANRKISFKNINDSGMIYFALGDVKDRVALLMKREVNNG